VLVQSIHIDGLRHAPGDPVETAQPFFELPSIPAGTACADALTLWRAALDLSSTKSALQHLDLTTDALAITDVHGRPEQISGLNPHAVRDLLGPKTALSVTLTLSLDPPLYGQLRQQALKDPWLVDALSHGSELSVRMGWLFTTDLQVASVSRLAVELGGCPLRAPGAAEPPAWVDAMLVDISRRVLRVQPRSPTEVAIRLLATSLDPVPAVRGRFDRASRAFDEPPFSYGRLHLVQQGDVVTAAFGPDLITSRHLGPGADEALRLVEAAIIDQPDVLVVESVGGHQAHREAVSEWLTRLTTGEDATLEQVLHVPGGPR